MFVQGGPKSKPIPNFKTLCQIVFKFANEIRFLRQLKEIIKYSQCDLRFDVNNYDRPTNQRYASHTVNDVSAPSIEWKI